MRFTRPVLVLLLILLFTPVAAGSSGSAERLIFVVDSATEAALATSTGADVVYGSGRLHDEVVTNKTVYAVGGGTSRFDTVPRSRVPRTVNTTATPLCPADVEKRMYAALAASLNSSAVVCASPPSPVNATAAELRDRYIRRIGRTGDEINHIVVSSPEMLPAAAGIAADQHALLQPVTAGDTADDTPATQVDRFENNSIDPWALQGEEHAVLATEQRAGMAGDAVASLDAAGTGSKTVVKTARTVQNGTLAAGTVLDALISFTRKDSHIPKIRYVDSSSPRNFFQLRFDPPGNNVWCKVQHGEKYDQANFGEASATRTVYRVRFTLSNGSLRCQLFDAAGDNIASTALDHPDGFSYTGIDTVEIVSQDETSIDIHFDNITLPAPAEHRSVDADTVTAAIRNASRHLSQYGMYLDGREQYTDGRYLSLVDVPPVTKQDPVEAGTWSLADPADGTSFAADLPYADFNGDGIVDAGVGRYPGNRSLASRMYLRSKYYEGKNALVAAEYLHANWPTILLYVGGGMFTGKSVGHVLERQGFDVSRAVEHRASPRQFLHQLAPGEIESVLAESDRVENLVSGVIGEGVGTAASQVFVTLKALEYIERTLQQYLEFEWATAGFDPERAATRLPGDGSSIGHAVADAAGASDTTQQLAGGVVTALETRGIKKGLASVVYAFFWPDRYPRITAARLAQGAAANDVIYYNGVGNRSAWVLPNNASTIAGMVDTGRYNGTNSFDAADVPANTASVVVDNADLAAATGGAMQSAFLRRGAAAYIGTSTVNYAPFSSEIDTRFFRHGYTVGGSLQQAVNQFQQDSITWDPANALARNNVKGKLLRSIRLYGNPEMAKDPAIPSPAFNRTVSCDDGICQLTLTANLTTSIVAENGARRLHTATADSRVLRSFRPIIPVLTADHSLPAAATVEDVDVHSRSHVVENVSVPVARPLSHGGRQLSANVSAGRFPGEAVSYRTRETAGNRTALSLTHAAFRYTASNSTATVYDHVSANMTYRTPYEMTVTVNDPAGTNASASVTVYNSGQQREAELLLQVRQPSGTRTRTRNLTLAPGTNTFTTPITVTGTGQRAVDAWLFVNGTPVGPRTATYTVHPPRLNITVSVPSTVERGERFTARVAVHNRGDATTRTLRLNGSAGIQPTFLQPASTEVVVPARGSRSWTVPLRAFSTGNATVTLAAGDAGSRATVTVKPVPGDRGSPTVTPSQDGFHRRETEDAAVLEIQRPHGQLRITKTRADTTTRLETGTFQATETDAPGRRTVTVHTGNGSFRRTTVNGRQSVVVNGTHQETAERIYDRLLQEKQKLLERYRIARNRTAASLPG